MSDFESFRREAGSQVVQPDFDDLVATSRRRRRTAAVSAVVAVAAVVGVVAFGLQGFGDQAAPVTPVGPSLSPTPTPAPTPDTPPSPDEPAPRLTATQVVNDRNARIVSVAVSDRFTAAKAVIWGYCVDRRCDQQEFAVTVTGDDFKTAQDIAIPVGSRYLTPRVGEVGSDVFYVSTDSTGFLVDTAGRVTDVTISKAARPMTSAEVLVIASDRYTYVGLNPTTGAAHPVPLPAGGEVGGLEQNPDGTLLGVARTSGPKYSNSVVWSQDGGATWSEHQLFKGGSLVSTIESASTEPILAVVQGADGATLMPFDTVHRSTDGGTTWQTFDESPDEMAYLGWSLIIPDGSLLVHIDGWSDGRIGRPSQHPIGLYLSDGENWADLRYVQDLPASSDPRSLTSGFTLGDYAATSSGELRLWIYDYNGDSLFESGPDIHTWAEAPAR